MALTSVFKDIFDGANGSQPDTSKWIQSKTNGYLLNGSGKVYQNIDISELSTNGKFSFIPTAEGIKIEVSMGSTSGGYDYGFEIKDSDGDRIRMGVTTYGGQGMYSYGTGKYNLGQTGYGYSQNTQYWYQMEIVGTTLYMRRSADRTSWTTVATRTLGSSITGKTFYFNLIGGGNPYYGGFFDEVELFQEKAVVANFMTFFNQYL